MDCFFSRIRTERNGGAWCPKQPISRDTYEWLEIDLQELKVVTQVETQGRFGYGQVRRFNDNVLSDVGVARILSGVHFSSPKKLTTFFLVVALKAHAKTA